jgi:hypothetical protein
MVKINFIRLIFYLSLTTNITGQVNLEWVGRYNGTANRWDVGNAIIVDDSGYVYVAGGSREFNNFEPDYVTIKYKPHGDTVWVQLHWSPGDEFDIARDIILDDSGNVYVTGVPVTIKYNSSGEVLWVYDNLAGFERILLDKSGDIYLAGTGVVTSWTDYVVRKLNPSGELLWYRNYNGTGDDIDRIRDAVLDYNDNLIVTGESIGTGTDYDYATIKYSPDGDSIWTRRYNGPGLSTPSDHAFAIAVDDSNNIYVTGWSDGLSNHPQCATIKYSPEGDLIWERRFPAGGNIGYAGYDIMYLQGFIYVVARAHFFNDTLLKYDLDGNLIWERVFVTNNIDIHNKALTSDKYGNIYMTSGGGVSPGSDYIALKYNPGGDLLWEYRYRPGSNASSRTQAICVDTSLNVYLTGEATGTGTNYDVVTLKLSQDTTTNVQEIEFTPSEFKLFPAYPNPFNPVTNITFSLPKGENVEIKIYNLLGEEIENLVSDNFTAGTHSINWSAGDLPSGIYLCKIQTGGYQKTIKLLLMK